MSEYWSYMQTLIAFIVVAPFLLSAASYVYGWWYHRARCAGYRAGRADERRYWEDLLVRKGLATLTLDADRDIVFATTDEFNRLDGPTRIGGRTDS